MKLSTNLLAVIALLLDASDGHESCLDGSSPKDHSTSTFKMCGSYKQVGCCDQAAEAAVFDAYEAAVASQDLSQKCRDLISEIFCQKCSPLSAHLYDGGTFEEKIFPNLCADFCSKLKKECGDTTAIFGQAICATDKINSADNCYSDSVAKDDVNTGHGSDEEDCIPVCFQTVLSGTKNIIGGAFPPDDTNRLFLLQQNGVIWELDSNRKKLEPPFLDITDRVVKNEKFDERGLLSMAFHPRFAENKLFYLFYNPDGHGVRSRIVKMRVNFSGPPMTVDKDSEEIILEFSKPQANHNGGQLLFGADGYLYISTGDGGGQGDRHGDGDGNGQSLATYLGKILRINIDSNHTYEIPADNPFADSSGNEFKEIYAYGFRNPWRMTLDRETGDIYVGDVGQNEKEEVDVLVKGGNYGWRGLEGENCFDERLCKSLKQNHMIQKPIYAYSHATGLKSVIGGYMYRGKAMPHLEGKYVFGDWVDSRQLWALENVKGDWIKRDLCVKKHLCSENESVTDTKTQLFAFTEDEEGEIYAMAAETSIIYKEDSVFFKLIPAKDRQR